MDQGAVKGPSGLLAQHSNNWMSKGMENVAELEAISLISFF